MTKLQIKFKFAYLGDYNLLLQLLNKWDKCKVKGDSAINNQR